MNHYMNNELSKRYSEFKTDHQGKPNKAIIDQTLDPKSASSCDKIDSGFVPLSLVR